MNTEFNKEVNEEIKRIQTEENNSFNTQACNAEIEEESPDFPTQSRKIRLILNKITDENSEKLVADLVTGFVYSFKLLRELIKLLFDRATSRNFAELYSKICGGFYCQIKSHNTQAYKAFKKCLNEKCDSILTVPDQSIISITKFVGMLFKLNLLKSTVIYQFFDLAVHESASESHLEAACNLIKLLGPYLVSVNFERVEKIVSQITSIDCEVRPKKIRFLIMDIIDTKDSILTPVSSSQSLCGTPFKDTIHFVKKSEKGVSFARFSEFEPVQSRQTKRILKQGVSEEVKSALRGAVGEYISGKVSLNRCRTIFTENYNKERQLINQIFKYALTEYNHEQEFVKICEMVIGITEAISKKEAIETGLMYTVEAIHDIQLDSPMAPQYLRFVINHLHDTGVIENATYLLDHFNS